MMVLFGISASSARTPEHSGSRRIRVACGHRQRRFSQATPLTAFFRKTNQERTARPAAVPTGLARSAASEARPGPPGSACPAPFRERAGIRDVARITEDSLLQTVTPWRETYLPAPMTASRRPVRSPKPLPGEALEVLGRPADGKGYKISEETRAQPKCPRRAREPPVRLGGRAGISGPKACKGK